MWDVMFSCILFCIEPNWYWQLTQIIMGVISIARAVQVWLTSLKSPCLPCARCFQLCLCPACSSSPLPPKLLFVLCPQHRYVLYLWTHSVFSLCSCQCRNDIYRGTLFRPLQFFCKVRYVNWPVLPFQSRCMCCMCAANRIIHSVSNPSLLMKYCCLLTTSQNHSSLGQYGLKDTDIFLNNFYLSTITQVMYWFMLFRKVINHFVSL